MQQMHPTKTLPYLSNMMKDWENVDSGGAWRQQHI